ncbi:hypothetical protein [Candidatus Kuenenia stuttgartiensis]|uniref:hypothetical protein n=1 Tax=Kuenenia stuttgartiensis TaxID=174633 RepID=UPI00146B02AA|nr:hypothetical protein [Candidatus Kuenenia stuttgartiensis]
MKESKEILLVGAKKRIANTSLTRLYTQTEGWAAGLVLIAEHIRTKGLDDTLRSGSIYEKAFDYFANEIFIKTDKKTQIFLLKTAFLPRNDDTHGRKTHRRQRIGTHPARTDPKELLYHGTLSEGDYLSIPPAFQGISALQGKGFF